MNDKVSVVALAKELVVSRKAKERMMTQKAQLMCIDMQLGSQIAMLKMQGAYQMSTEVMQAFGAIMSVGRMTDTMRTMEREMTKAGLISEMMDEAMDSDPDLDEAADEEVANVMREIVPELALPTEAVPPAQSVAAPTGEQDDELAAMSRRLEALKAAE